MVRRGSLWELCSLYKNLSILKNCSRSTCMCHFIWAIWLENGWNFSTWPFYSLKDKLFFVLIQIFHSLLRFCQWSWASPWELFTLSSLAHSGYCHGLRNGTSPLATSNSSELLESCFCSISWNPPHQRTWVWIWILCLSSSTKLCILLSKYQWNIKECWARCWDTLDSTHWLYTLGPKLLWKSGSQVTS